MFFGIEIETAIGWSGEINVICLFGREF